MDDGAMREKRERERIGRQAMSLAANKLRDRLPIDQSRDCQSASKGQAICIIKFASQAEMGIAEKVKGEFETALNQELEMLGFFSKSQTRNVELHFGVQGE